MSESKRRHAKHEQPDLGVVNGQPAYWRRAHHDWRFWVAIISMLAAISIYFLSDNLAFLPHG